MCTQIVDVFESFISIVAYGRKYDTLKNILTVIYQKAWRNTLFDIWGHNTCQYEDLSNLTNAIIRKIELETFKNNSFGTTESTL